MEINERLALLVIKMQDNNQQAFTELIELTQVKLYKTAFFYLRDPMLAEDVVDDTYLTLLQKCKSLKCIHNISGLLNTIVINKSINVLKKRKREIQNDEEFIKNYKGRKTADEIINEIVVRDCMASLKKAERQVLLYRANGFTLNEIADMMSFSIKKVRILIEKSKNNFVKLYNSKDL